MWALIEAKICYDQVPWFEMRTKRTICGTKQPEFSVAQSQHNIQNS
jgi:hypothetical protein